MGSTWDDKGEYNLPLTTGEALKNGAYVTMDVLFPGDAAFGGVIKLQGVAGIGDNWSWTEADNIPELTSGSFTKTAEGCKKAEIRFDFGAGVTADVLKQFALKLAGYQCDYRGAVYVENIKLYNGIAQEEPLPEAEAPIMDDFEEGQTGGWSGAAIGEHWQYESVVLTSVERFEEALCLSGVFKRK